MRSGGRRKGGIDKTIWERARAAAEVVTATRAGRSRRLPASGITVEMAAKQFGLHRSHVVDARRILSGAFPDDLVALAEGRIAMGRVATDLRRGATSGLRAHADRKQQDKERRRVRGAIWSDLREALLKFTSLPSASDAIEIAKAFDRQGLVDDKLEIALLWLMEFHDGWEKYRADEASKAGENHDGPDHARDGG